jgi:predicted metalloprotease
VRRGAEYRGGMTFNPDAKINGSKVSRRGRTTGLAVGGGGLGVLLLVLLGPLLGVDLTGLLGGTGAADTSVPGTSDGLERCRTGADANENLDCRMAGAALSIDTYWASDSSLRDYRSPQFRLFTGSTTTGCGVASSATGPFYCPTDESIYLDTGFFEELRSRFDASGGPLAQMYVVAHEWGHHIQNVSGIMDGLDLRDTGPASDSVRLELQADCFAGAWAGSASSVPDESGTPFLEPITRQQVADALNAASAIGDDRIQQRSNGQVNSEVWTHGSSAQRQQWFETGFTEGPGGCATFGGGL